ncbi:hypothetical protein ACH5RR_012689 [Cinchona calisaya]|uniref:Uncharacterized protein n=1 Tax=Cinchona calisaya TaxID=153742 RepID=A0ABD3AE99_9GENT
MTMMIEMSVPQSSPIHRSGVVGPLETGYDESSESVPSDMPSRPQKGIDNDDSNEMVGIRASLSLVCGKLRSFFNGKMNKIENFREAVTQTRLQDSRYLEAMAQDKCQMETRFEAARAKRSNHWQQWRRRQCFGCFSNSSSGGVVGVLAAAAAAAGDMVLLVDGKKIKVVKFRL